MRTKYHYYFTSILISLLAIFLAVHITDIVQIPILVVAFALIIYGHTFPCDEKLN